MSVATGSQTVVVLKQTARYKTNNSVAYVGYNRCCISTIYCNWKSFYLFYRVNGDLNVRVSDFGLSRVVTNGTDYYRMGSKKQLPVKWMAPECLTDGLFTTFSDVVRQCYNR